MTIQQKSIPTNQRRPIGAIMGKLGVGKTTQMVRAFPKWAFIKSDVSALDAAVDLIENDAEGAAALGLTESPPVQVDLINDNETSWIDWVEGFRAWVDGVMQARADAWQQLPKDKRKENKHLRLLLAGSSQQLGIHIPEPGVPGVVITEATTLWQWVTTSGQRSRGRGYDTNDAVSAALEELMGVFQKWNLGLFFDGHVAEPVAERGYPRGFNWPFGRMRETCARPLAIVWELVMEAEDDSGEDVQYYFLTRAGYGPDNPLGTIRKTRRHGLPARLELNEKSMRDWLEEIRFRCD